MDFAPLGVGRRDTNSARPHATSRSIVIIACAALLLCATPARAQSTAASGTAVALLNRLFEPGIPFNPDGEPLLSQAEFQRRQEDSIQGIAIGLGNALASFPLGASSAGFTYVVDRVTGQRVLKSLSFGPVFVERALTNGRGVFNLGFSFQGASFDTLQGVDLKNDGFVTQSQLGTYEIDGSDVGDSWRAMLDVKSKVFVVSGSYGLTEHLDFGWAVPIASITMESQFLRDYNGGRDWDADLYAGEISIRSLYPNKIGTEVLRRERVEATGIGDIVLRGKFAFGPADHQIGLLSAELRLPTGDADNLLGTGKTSLRMVAGVSARSSSASLNVNGGYTVGGLTDEINLSAGTEVALLPRKQLTVSLDFISQTLRDTVTNVDQLVSFDRTISNVANGFLPRRVIVQYGFWNRGSTTLTRAAVGAKYNLAGNWLLTGTVLFRLNDNGFQAKVVPFVGLERTWTVR